MTTTTMNRAKQGTTRLFLGLGLAACAAGFASPAWAALSVSLTAPASGAVFQAGATITLTATATDSTGATATSKSVSIKVNAPPTVSLTAPANNAVFNPGSTIALAATAADSDGTISKVEFFRGTTLIGSDTTSPYSFNWTSVPTGAYTLTARATDNLGRSTTSAAVAIRVDAAPTVSITAPANNAVFTPPANITVTAADTDGTVTKVEFFDGATLVGSGNVAPYSVTLANAAAGTHTLTARASDNNGAVTTSGAVSAI